MSKTRRMDDEEALDKFLDCKEVLDDLALWFRFGGDNDLIDRLKKHREYFTCTAEIETTDADDVWEAG